LFEQAIAIDRHYGPALAWAATCHQLLVTNGWAAALETNRHKATDLARQALQVAENDAGVLANAALVLAFFGEDIGAMIGLVERALALNPSYARGWLLSGFIRTFAGQHDLAIEHIETSLRLSPRDRVSTPLLGLGTAYFSKRRFDEAAAKLLLSIQDQPGHPGSYRFLAACCAHMGRLDEARAIVARLRTTGTPKRYWVFNMAEALRAAGYAVHVMPFERLDDVRRYRWRAAFHRATSFSTQRRLTL